jgi:hypothetical protein
MFMNEVSHLDQYPRLNYHESDESEELYEEVLWAFGKSLVDFEPDLYIKFHTIQTKFILDENSFHEVLVRMAHSNIIKSGIFLGMQTWTKNTDTYP